MTRFRHMCSECSCLAECSTRARNGFLKYVACKDQEKHIQGKERRRVSLIGGLPTHTTHTVANI